MVNASLSGPDIIVCDAADVRSVSIVRRRHTVAGGDSWSTSFLFRAKIRCTSSALWLVVGHNPHHSCSEPGSAGLVVHGCWGMARNPHWSCLEPRYAGLGVTVAFWDLVPCIVMHTYEHVICFYQCLLAVILVHMHRLVGGDGQPDVCNCNIHTVKAGGRWVNHSFEER